MYQNSKNSNNSFVIVGNYDYIMLTKMYDNILDKRIIKECGYFLYSKDGMTDMLRLHNVIDEIITYNVNKANNDKYDRMAILSLPRLIEHWWEGIGDWMAYYKTFLINIIKNVYVLSLNLNAGPPNTQP